MSVLTNVFTDRWHGAEPALGEHIDGGERRIRGEAQFPLDGQWKTGGSRC